MLVVLEDGYPNFSIRGLPSYLSGETPDWRSLAHRSAADMRPRASPCWRTALVRRGVGVTLVHRAGSVPLIVDAALGADLADELGRHGVEVRTGEVVTSIERRAGALEVRIADGSRCVADLVLLAAGVRADARLAEGGGAELGPAGSVGVDRQMRTSVPDVLAAGDCVQTWHRQLGWVHLPLGTTAHKQGRVAGENAVGGSRSFAGSIGTQVVKVFDLVAARTGLRDDEARGCRVEPAHRRGHVRRSQGLLPGRHPHADQGHR